MKIKNYWNKIMDYFGFKDQIEQAENDGIKKNHKNKKSKSKIVSLNRTQEYRLIFQSPESYNEVKSIVDDIKDRNPVILNLERVEREQAKKIIDFISGAVYGLNGNVQKIGKDVFLFTPSNVTVDGQKIQKTIDENLPEKEN